MAPTFKHGKSARVWWGSVNASTMVKSVKFTGKCETGDTTVLGLDDRRAIAGLKTGEVQMSGYWDGSTGSPNLDAIVYGLMGSTSQFPLTFMPHGDTAGNPARLADTVEVAADVNAPVDGVVEAEFGAQVTGGPRFGLVTKALAAQSATGAGTTVDTSVFRTTAQGLVAHLHVTAKTALTSASFILQHSSNGSSWATHTTLTAVTSTGYQRSNPLTSVKRYVRTNLNALTGTSVTAGMAVAKSTAGG